MSVIRFMLFTFLVFMAVACSYKIPTHKERLLRAESLTQKRDFQQLRLKSDDFSFFSYAKNLQGCRVAHIYIEGDGFAWRTSSQISQDPTPLNPLALKLATEDERSCVIYLARPCQYISSKECFQKYWTSHRFSKKVIKNYEQLLDSLKREYGIESFELYGYSGGGAVATLIAAFRNDVSLLVTIAGNIDTKKWCEIHYLTPLSASLNPAEYIQEVENIPQIHLIGGDDTNVKKDVFDAYIAKAFNRDKIAYKIYPGFTHSKGWAGSWKSILKELKNN